MQDGTKLIAFRDFRNDPEKKYPLELSSPKLICKSTVTQCINMQSVGFPGNQCLNYTKMHFSILGKHSNATDNYVT